jgi:hypothetical protein
MRTTATRLLLTIASLATAGLPAWAGDTRVETPAGPLVITTRDDEVTVAVRGGGKQIVLEDTKTGQKLTLIDGQLQQRVSDDSIVMTSQFSLKRGGKVVAEVRLDAPVATFPAASLAADREPAAPGVTYEAVTTYQYDANTKTYAPITRYIVRNTAAIPAFPPAVVSLGQSDGPKEPGDLPTADFSKYESEEALRTYATTVEATKDDAKVISVLREYLRRYPDSSTATTAQRKMGLAFWRLAREEESCGRRENASGSQAHLARRKKFLEESRAAFDSVEQTYLAQALIGHTLSDPEAQYLKQSAFWGADCDYYLGQYEQANRRYAALVIRYRDNPEELIAESQQLNCLIQLQRDTEAQTLLGHIKRRIGAVKFKTGDDLPATHNKGYWEKWFNEVTPLIRADVLPGTSF